MTTESPDPFKLILFPAQSGALSARLEREDGTAIHLHSLVDPEKEAVYFSDLRFWGDRVILAGCGLGYHLKRAVEQATDAARILILEYYDELSSRCCAYLPAEVRNRVTVVSRTDRDAAGKVSRFLSGGTYIQIVKHPASFHAHHDYYRQLLSVIAARPVRQLRPERVMVMQGDFFLERELGAAAEGSTTTVVPFRYKKWETVTAYESELQKQFQTARPDAVISINMLGCDGNGVLAEYCNRSGIPLLIWFVDDPRPIVLNRKRHITDAMKVFSWERSYIPWLRQQGFGAVRHLPLASDPRQFSERKSPGVPVPCGFVGTAMGSSFLREIALKFLWKPEYAPVAATVAMEMLNGKEIDVDWLIDNECRNRSVVFPSDGDHTRTWLRSYTLHVASMIKRKRLITGLHPLGVETFGDPDGWREVCGPLVRTHPDIDYRTEIAACYRAVTVNLNSTSCQMPTALNQRVFDVPLCGAFIINDNQSDLHEFFSDGEFVVYESPEDCCEKVRYYQQHEAARNQISSAACRRIRNEHTYSHRLHSLLASV
jgi:spore maturation protein CgeB